MTFYCICIWALVSTGLGIVVGVFLAYINTRNRDNWVKEMTNKSEKIEREPKP